MLDICIIHKTKLQELINKLKITYNVLFFYKNIYNIKNLFFFFFFFFFSTFLFIILIIPNNLYLFTFIYIYIHIIFIYLFLFVCLFIKKYYLLNKKISFLKIVFINLF